MLDRHIRPLIDPPLNRIGCRMAARGISANSVTLVGLGLGLVAALVIAHRGGVIAVGHFLVSPIARLRMMKDNVAIFRTISC